MWFLHPSARILLKLVGTKWYPGAKWSLQQPRPSVEHLYWMKMLLQRQQFWQYWQLQKLLKLTLKRMLGKVQKPLTKYFQADAQGTNGAKVLFSVVRCWTLVLWALSGKLTWIFYLFFFISDEKLAKILYKTRWWGKSQQMIWKIWKNRDLWILSIFSVQPKSKAEHLKCLHNVKPFLEDHVLTEYKIHFCPPCFIGETSSP